MLSQVNRTGPNLAHVRHELSAGDCQEGSCADEIDNVHHIARLRCSLDSGPSCSCESFKQFVNHVHLARLKRELSAMHKSLCKLASHTAKVLNTVSRLALPVRPQVLIKLDACRRT